MGKTSIEWCDVTWNPVRGCSRVSEGCRNCYAERQAARFAGPGKPFEGFVHIVNGHPAWTGKVELVEDHLEDPLHWRKPQRVFVNSMSDLFHENLSLDDVARIFAVMALCPQHTFQILTKRPERMLGYCGLAASDPDAYLWAWCDTFDVPIWLIPPEPQSETWPLRNVWLGVSVEDRENKLRIDLLRQTPAAIRFLSIEPLLEDIGELDLTGIHQVIVGGESGPRARPFDIQWARDIIAQCKAANVAVFLKQVGSAPVSVADRISHRGDTTKRLRWCYRYLTDKKGGDMSEWPEDVRVREFPNVVSVEREAGTV